jgi:hypothetical protein
MLIYFMHSILSCLPWQRWRKTCCSLRSGSCSPALARILGTVKSSTKQLDQLQTRDQNLTFQVTIKHQPMKYVTHFNQTAEYKGPYI